MNYRAVVFDLGGTLLEYAGVIDTWPELEGPGFEAAHNHLSRDGLNLPDFALFQAMGFEVLPPRWQEATAGKRNLTVESLLKDVLTSLNVKLPPDLVLHEAASKYQSAVCSRVSAMPHSLETVRAVHDAGYKLGLVSNTMFAGKMHIADMHRFDLDTFFDAMVFSADVNKWKPNPEVFHHVLDRLQVPPEQSVFLGDDPNVDVAGGLQTGMYTIHYVSSQRFNSIEGAQPDASIRSLEELPRLLARLNSVAGSTDGSKP